MGKGVDMAIGDPTTTSGLLTIIFTEVVLLVVFHGPVGAAILEPFYGSEHLLAEAAHVH